MTASPAAPVRTVAESELHLSATTPQKSGSMSSSAQPRSTGQPCCPILGGLLRAWKGLHYSPQPVWVQRDSTALQNYLITGQESKDSFRTIFLGLVSRTCFWVSSKAPCAHKKPGKHLILQVKRHFQDSKELSFGGNRLLCWQPLKHGCDITETFSPTLKFL